MRVFLSVVLGALLCAGLTLVASADSYRGTWTLSPGEQPGMLSLNLEYHRRDARGNESWSDGHDVPLSMLPGVTPADLSSPGETKAFEIVTDAGTFSATGSFAHGNGAGTWTFAPSVGFRAELEQRGVRGLDDAAQFHLAMSLFKLSTLDALLHAGFQTPSAGDLTSMIEHGVDDAYIMAMSSLPLDPKTTAELTELRDHGVTASYAAFARRVYPSVTGGDLIELVDHGVTMRYLQGLQELGYHPSAQEAVRLVDHGVTIGYITELRSHGYSHLGVDDLIRLRDHGVE